MRTRTSAPAVLGAVAALLAVTAGPAGAVAPPAPPGCGTENVTTFSNTTAEAIPDNSLTGVSSSAFVAGGAAFIHDVDLTTDITHTSSAQLRIFLTSPSGTLVTISTGNGGTNDDVFAGTLWDDRAGSANPPGPVSDSTYANGVAESPLAPEEPLGALRGESPNGTWTLRVADSAAGGTGTRRSWGLSIHSCSADPASAATDGTATGPGAIPDGPFGAAVSSVIPIAGAACYLSGLTLDTQIRHAFPSDLEVKLISPANTELTVTSGNGGGFNDDVFNGTLWDDKAGSTNPPGPATDAAYTDGITATPLAPEEGLSALAGENPNGNWTMTVRDMAGGDTGFFDGWAIHLRTLGACPAPTGGGPATDATKPSLQSMSVTKRFRSAKKGASVASPLGGRVRFRLSEAARTTFRVQRKAAGRRAGRKCVKPTRKNRKAKRCTRWLRVKGSFARSGKAGANSFRFTGRIGGRRLRRGSYRLVATAVDAAGNRSAARTAAFKIVRR